MTGLRRLLPGLLAALAILCAAPAARATGDAAPANAHLPAAPPPVGELPRFETPATRTVELDNGLTATFIPWGMTPTVDIRVVVRAGNIDEGEDTWLSDLTVAMMAEGSAGRSADETAEAFAEMGGSLGSGVLIDRSTFATFVLSEHGPGAIALLADAVRRPDFPEASYDRVRETMMQDVGIGAEQPVMLASAAAARHQYPPGHPFHNVLPSREQVAGYSLADLRDFHATHFGAGRTRIYVAGRFDEAAMEAAIREHFGDWEHGPEDRGIDAVPAAENVVHLIDRPGAPQSTVLLMYPVAPIQAKSAAAIEVMDATLGGLIASQMREAGYSYAPQAFLEWTRGGGLWTYSDDIDTAQTVSALHDTLTIIDYARFQPFQTYGTKEWMASLFMMSIGSSEGLLANIAQRDQFGLPPDYLDTYTARIRAVPDTAVTAVAREFLSRDRMMLVVVGDMERIEADIRAMPQLQDARIVRE